jgi:hypothetical protein
MSNHAEAVEDIKKAKDAVDAMAQPKNVSLGNMQKAANIPDPTKHKYISFAKSAVRIGAGGALIYGDIFIAGALFIAAEILGVVEELV